jgi:pantoate kinase
MSPSKTPRQKKFMAAAAHSKEFAKKAGISQKVAKEFHKADKKKGKKR